MLPGPCVLHRGESCLHQENNKLSTDLWRLQRSFKRDTEGLRTFDITGILQTGPFAAVLGVETVHLIWCEAHLSGSQLFLWVSHTVLMYLPNTHTHTQQQAWLRFSQQCLMDCCTSSADISGVLPHWVASSCSLSSTTSMLPVKELQCREKRKHMSSSVKRTTWTAPPGEGSFRCDFLFSELQGN